jgi:hypothetical protein
VRYEILDSSKSYRVVTYPTGTKDGTISWVGAVVPKEGSESGNPVVASAMVPFGSKTKLSDLDLLRGQIPLDCDLQVGLQVLYLSQKLTLERIKTINTALGKSAAPLPEIRDLDTGVTLAVWVSIGATTHKRLLRKPAPKALGMTSQDPVDSETDDAIKVERVLGPLHLRQVRVRLLPTPAGGSGGARLVLGLDAAFLAAGFELEATGLGLSVELVADPRIEVVLAGLGAAYSRDPLHIVGALVSRPPDDKIEFAYDGLIMVKATKWGFMAVGSYARLKAVEGHPAYTSLFIFGALEGKIGGPPPVVFTGLCLGFGYNSAVKLPEASQVTEFPFLKALGDMKGLTGVEPGQPVSPTTVLQKVTGGTTAVVVPANGSMWIAAGLSFSVAETLDVQALLMVQFGDDLVVTLLGSCVADFPARATGSTQTPSVAHLELGFRALYEHAKRQFSLTAALSDSSWVVHKDCKLTGGAALYVWLPGSAHEGDFVATVGGYHPQFKKPAHYPQVPRLGVSWAVSSAVSVRGELYVAITPALGMVGGRLEVNYDAGGLRAWLIAYFNAVVQWAPLSFRAEIRITIGATYTAEVLWFTVTVRAEIGAVLHVWGPPTGGRAQLSVGPFSVAIRFGELEIPPAPKLTWAEFSKQLLPKAPVTLSVLDGLLTDPVKATRASRGLWVVSTDGFSFATGSTVPATEIKRNETSINLKDQGRQKQLNIRPMGVKNGTSTHTVTITEVSSKKARAQELTNDAQGWEVEPVYAAVPAALWGSPLDGHPQLDAEPRVVYATGLRVSVRPPELSGAKVETTLEAIKDEIWRGKVNPLQHTSPRRSDVTPPTSEPATTRTAMRKILTELHLLEATP